MSVHSIQRKRRRDPTRIRYKSLGCHDEFLSRICKSLYYAELPSTERLSLPITEVAAELFSEVKVGRSLDRLGLEEASGISRNACVSPASLILALLYLERLKVSSPEYLDTVSSTQLFLVSSLVASKFLNDDGEEDEVLNSEWAVSADIPLNRLNKLEKEFLSAINWEVYVETDEFWRRLEMLEEQIALRQATKRGFFTYSDLLALVGYIDSLSLAHTLFSVGAVCLTAYAASVVSMVGSTVLVSALQKTTSFNLQRLPSFTSINSDPSMTSINPTEANEQCRLSWEQTNVTGGCVDSVPSVHQDTFISFAGTLDDRENLTESCHYSNNGSCYPSYDFRWLGEEAFTRLLPDYIFGSVIQPLYA